MPTSVLSVLELDEKCNFVEVWIDPECGIHERYTYGPMNCSMEEIDQMLDEAQYQNEIVLGMSLAEAKRAQEILSEEGLIFMQDERGKRVLFA